MQIATFTGLKAFSGTALMAPAPQKRMCAGRNALTVRASVVAEPATFQVKKLDGSSAGTANLALKVAEDDTAKGLVHRYLVMGNASTLTRGEVRGGGRKPYRQKGTGNARRGSRRSPLMPGGGISFGPKPRDWSISMNKKERRLALATALQTATADMVVVEDFAGKFEEVKTKSFVEKLEKLGCSTDEKTLIILNEANEHVYLSGRNIQKLAINTANAVQVYDVLAADKIVIEQSALAYLNEFYGAPSE